MIESKSSFINHHSQIEKARHRAWPRNRRGCGRVAVCEMRLRDAALADKRHPHDARFGPRGVPPYRRTLHVPPGRFVPARRTQQRHAALREVEQRVVPVEAADKLPQLLPNSCHHSGGLGESVCLHRIDRHSHVPLGGSPPLIRTPCGVSAVRPPPSRVISREMPEQYCWKQPSCVQRVKGACTGWRISRAARNSAAR